MIIHEKMEPVMLLMRLLIILKCCHGEGVVSLLKVMADGHYDSDEGPLGQEISVPDNWTGNQLTFSFWISPFRYLGSDSIISVLLPAPTFSFKFIEGNLVIRLISCIITTEIRPEIREWTHLSVTVSNQTEIFINGTLDSVHDCKLRSDKFPLQTEMFLVVGAVGGFSKPFSGNIADFRMYWKSLTADEVNNVYKIMTEPSGYVTTSINPFDNDDEEDSFPGPISHKESYVENSLIPKEQLTQAYVPYLLLYVSEEATFEKAVSVCRNRRGTLPNTTVHGQETIIQLIYTFSENTGISIPTFWMSSNEEGNCYTGSYETESKIIEETPETCSNSKINYFCIVKKKESLKLVGYNDDPISFFPLPFETGSFESEKNLKLFLQHDKFFLKDVFSDELLYYSLVSKTDELIGRQKWINEEIDMANIDLLLTGCQKGEFTCSNGDCIDINLACNRNQECEDNTDELFCEVGIPPSEYYDSRLPPQLEGDQPTKLNLYFEIKRITDVSTYDNTMSMHVYIRVNWTDPRLDFKFLQKGREFIVAKKIFEQYWRPDIFVKGAESGQESVLSFNVNHGKLTATAMKEGVPEFMDYYEVMSYSGRNVVLSNENLIPLTIKCHMDLFLFPFDEQTCSFSIILYNQFTSNIEWVLEDENAVSLDDDASLSLYIIMGFEFKKETSKEIQMSLTIARKYGAFMFNTFLPCVLLEMIGLLTMVFPTSDYSDRVTVTLSCLIVVAALFIQTGSTLPQSAEPKLLDVWTFVHIVVMMLTFLVHIIVIYLHDKETIEEQKEAMKNEIIKSDLYPKIFGGASVNDGSLTKAKKSSSVVTSAWDKVEAQEKKSCRCYITSERMNKIGTVLCISSYILFLVMFYFVAIGYWKIN